MVTTSLQSVHATPQVSLPPVARPGGDGVSASTPMEESCAGASALRWSLDDENGDGRLDLVFFFDIQDLNLTLSSTSARLMAHGSYAGTDMHIEGMDSVQVVR